MRHAFDHVTLVGLAGLLASLTLDQWNSLAGLVAGSLAAIYTGCRLVMLFRRRAGSRDSSSS